LVDEFLPSRFDHGLVHPNLKKRFAVEVRGVEENNIQNAKHHGAALPFTVIFI
jgi:hypothetical protein